MNSTSKEIRPTVLMVDDEQELLAVLKDAVESLGYLVIATINPNSALEAILTATPARPIDAVVSDINMPMLAGIDLLRRVREARRDVPFVFLTGDDDRATVVEALRLGACDFLAKPVQRAKLLEAVKGAVLLGVAGRQAEAEVNRLMGLSGLPPERAAELREAQRRTILMKLKKQLG